MTGAEREDRSSLERMDTAKLEELLREDFRAEEGGASCMDGLLHAAEELARRERPAGEDSADRAWEAFREKYLPFHGEGVSLYEDAEAPDASDAAHEPRHSSVAQSSRRTAERGM